MEINLHRFNVNMFKRVFILVTSVSHALYQQSRKLLNSKIHVLSDTRILKLIKTRTLPLRDMSSV